MLGDLAQRVEVTQPDPVELVQAPVIASLGEDRDLLDRVDAEVGFEIEVELEHVGGIARARDQLGAQELDDLVLDLVLARGRLELDARGLAGDGKWTRGARSSRSRELGLPSLARQGRSNPRLGCVGLRLANGLDVCELADGLRLADGPGLADGLRLADGLGLAGGLDVRDLADGLGFAGGLRLADGLDVRDLADGLGFDGFASGPRVDLVQGGFVGSRP